MLERTKSLIRARFKTGLLSTFDLFDLKVFILNLEREERRLKIKEIQKARELSK